MYTSDLIIEKLEQIDLQTQHDIIELEIIMGLR